MRRNGACGSILDTKVDFTVGFNLGKSTVEVYGVKKMNGTGCLRTSGPAFRSLFGSP